MYLTTDAGRASRVGKVGWTRTECRQRSGSAQLSRVVGKGSRMGNGDTAPMAALRDANWVAEIVIPASRITPA